MDPGVIRAAADRLRAGGVVAFPTETVYGLGADAFSAAAVARVFALKGRPAHNPLIVHVSGPEMAQSVIAPGAWSQHAQRLARAFWPGPLTIVLPRAERVPEAVAAGGSTVAVRSPDHPTALALLYALGAPLVGPSANRSGDVSPTRAEHVRQAFPDESEVLVLDGGACPVGIESTVVDISDERTGPRVLRPGAIDAAMLARVLECDVVGASSPAGAHASDGHGIVRSPGMLDRHYAPRTPAHLVRSEGDDRDRLDALLARARSAGVRVVVLGPANVVSGASTERLVPMPTDAHAYAARVYAALREADAHGADAILVLWPVPGASDDPLWSAILDRLRRACEPGAPAWMSAS